MRQQPSGRRPRGRSNRKHYVPHKAHTFDSHGPDVRVRGNAMQVYEKYLALGRDAFSSGDRIAAESYFQFAEHYFRILKDSTDPQRPAPERPRSASGPYPVNAEQPFVDGTAGAPLPGGNGETPKADVSAAGAEARSPAEGGSPAPAEKAEAKPRGRGRPRTKAEAGDGANAETGASDNESAEPSPGEPSETSDGGD